MAFLMADDKTTFSLNIPQRRVFQLVKIKPLYQKTSYSHRTKLVTIKLKRKTYNDLMALFWNTAKKLQIASNLPWTVSLHDFGSTEYERERGGVDFLQPPLSVYKACCHIRLACVDLFDWNVTIIRHKLLILRSAHRLTSSHKADTFTRPCSWRKEKTHPLFIFTKHC